MQASTFVSTRTLLQPAEPGRGRHQGVVPPPPPPPPPVLSIHAQTQHSGPTAPKPHPPHMQSLELFLMPHGCERNGGGRSRSLPEPAARQRSLQWPSPSFSLPDALADLQQYAAAATCELMVPRGWTGGEKMPRFWTVLGWRQLGAGAAGRWGSRFAPTKMCGRREI